MNKARSGWVMIETEDLQMIKESRRICTWKWMELGCAWNERKESGRVCTWEWMKIDGCAWNDRKETRFLMFWTLKNELKRKYWSCRWEGQVVLNTVCLEVSKRLISLVMAWKRWSRERDKIWMWYYLRFENMYGFHFLMCLEVIWRLMGLW